VEILSHRQKKEGGRGAVKVLQEQACGRDSTVNVTHEMPRMMEREVSHNKEW